MVAATRRPSTLACRPRRRVLLTIWAAGKRITGAYIGFHLEGGAAYVVLIEWVGAEPRRIDVRDIWRAVWHRAARKRHTGAEA